jgi:tyrosyl-tRNA synthetase
MSLADTLRARGFVYQFSSETLEEITDPSTGGKRTFYLGVDPTADSIHAGNLAVYMMLRHIRAAGHSVILLIGGGTGMIGDPKPDVERPLTPPEVVAERAAKISAQVSKLLGGSVNIVNNYDWLSTLDLIGFLRDIGKHFTVNNLMKKDAIAKRLESEEGITYTEFAYPLLQGYDFWHLYKTRGCDVQVSGSDQWGNIMAGVELIRRKENASAYALTIPLITDASGKKFGKSEGNAVWLDPEKTSVYAFYQFWLNQDDASVEQYLKIFTDLSIEEIASIITAHHQNPGARTAQRELARAATAVVHGTEEAERAERVSEYLFGSGWQGTVDTNMRDMIATAAPTHTPTAGESLADVLVASGLASSKREAREFLSAGAVTLNGEKVDEARALQESDFASGIALIKRGKRNVCVLLRA